jgi:hypothetical protein
MFKVTRRAYGVAASDTDISGDALASGGRLQIEQAAQLFILAAIARQALGLPAQVGHFAAQTLVLFDNTAAPEHGAAKIGKPVANGGQRALHGAQYKVNNAFGSGNSAVTARGTLPATATAAMASNRKIKRNGGGRRSIKVLSFELLSLS